MQVYFTGITELSPKKMKTKTPQLKMVTDYHYAVGIVPKYAVLSSRGRV